MIKIREYSESFFEELKRTKRKLVLYGIGQSAQVVYPFLENIAYICDKKAERDSVTFHGHEVISLDKLSLIKEQYIVLICIKDTDICKQICDEFNNRDIDADIFLYCNNIDFGYYHSISESKPIIQQLKSVNLVVAEEGWILDKFAIKMKEQLDILGYDAQISNIPNPKYDINHYIAYHHYEPIKGCNDTIMITHVDSLNKIRLIKAQLCIAKMGICMSKDTMNQLVINGVPREKLCYINPPQDGVIKPKKYVLGITHRTYDNIDKRKRATALLDICKRIDPEYFSFKIMGAGWSDIIHQLEEKGFEVKYYEQFDYNTYVNLIPSLDYYLYWGFDEGSMGYLDALAAGIGTIVTPQGYHLDMKGGPTFCCNTIQDFEDVLLELEWKRKKIVNSIKEHTWSNYTEKHVEIWKGILGITQELYTKQHMYMDGIFSTLPNDI